MTYIVMGYIVMGYIAMAYMRAHKYLRVAIFLKLNFLKIGVTAFKA